MTMSKTRPLTYSWSLVLARGLACGLFVLLVVVAGSCSWSWWGLARGLARGRVGLAGGLRVVNLVRLRPGL